MLSEVHINDRKMFASRLNLSLDRFDTLLTSANHAHEFITKMGPFYGREDHNEPTFRITAEPVRLPKTAKKQLTEFGSDLLYLGKKLSKLPYMYKKMIGTGVDFRIPLTWRIDSILARDGSLKVNEVEGIDSVSALMMIEQLAYGLQPMEETTIMRFIESLQKIYLVSESRPPLQMAILRNDLENNPFTPNARRFIEILYELSKGMITCDLFDLEQLRTKAVTPNWQNYSAVMNESYSSLLELQKFGIEQSQILTAGNYSALVNKGIFALLFEPSLENFWKEELGKERHTRLKNILIPSRFVTTVDELQSARKEGKVVKVTWADGNMIIVNRAKGVAIPVGDIDENSEDRWEFLQECINKGYTLISQDYIEPTTIHAYLRKRGITLEEVNWHNRICVKYVVEGNPNAEMTNSVFMTAVEVTLGPDVIPAGRSCAFTAGTFA